jgi:hypothetical protein
MRTIIKDGEIVNVDISSAAIEDTKWQQLPAGKVSNSATTAT